MNLVSVITVCYNAEKHIEQTIQSVLAQSYKPIDYVLIDGNSTDGTMSIIKKYAALYPSVIRYLSEPDTGIYNAMNKGIQLATGELVGIINSDDWYEVDAVERVVQFYKQHGPAVYHGIQRTYRNEEVVGLQCTSANQLIRGMIEHPTCFVPRQVYEQHGIFDESYRYVGDYDLMLRLYQSSVPFVRIEQVLANFREGGASHSFDAVQENYLLWFRKGLQSKGEYIYRSIMDRIKLYAGRGHTSK